MLRSLLSVLAVCSIASSGVSAESTPKSLTISPQGPNQAISLASPDARQQLIVTGKSTDGSDQDVTRTVKYSSSPEGIVSIDETGLVTPLADGEATVTASLGGINSQTRISVSGFAHPKPINFKNQIVPIFTKLGCNSGGCHGKASGQNGFKLSLLGFYPDEDFEFLVKEARGRRVFPAAPDRSLLLIKAIRCLSTRRGKADGEGQLRIPDVVPVDPTGNALRFRG